MSNDQLVGVIAILSMLLLASRSFRGLGVPRARMVWMALLWFTILGVIGLIVWIVKTEHIANLT